MMAPVKRLVMHHRALPVKEGRGARSFSLGAGWIPVDGTLFQRLHKMARWRDSGLPNCILLLRRISWSAPEVILLRHLRHSLPVHLPPHLITVAW